MASVVREEIPKTAIKGKCPWCGAEPMFVDPPSGRSWHPSPACEGYMRACRSHGSRCEGYREITNLHQFEDPPCPKPN